MKNHSIELVARAVIMQGGRVLLCKRKDRDYYFLPGGHVEWGESAEQAIARELKEELNISFKKFSLIGVVENFFGDCGRKYHEINLVFFASCGTSSQNSLEDHLEFCLAGRSEFSKMRVVPKALQKAILKWLKNKKPFWGTEGSRRGNGVDYQS